jgi:hypothetical protein
VISLGGVLFDQLRAESPHPDQTRRPNLLNVSPSQVLLDLIGIQGQKFDYLSQHEVNNQRTSSHLCQKFIDPNFNKTLI